MAGSYKLVCARCKYLREWPEKHGRERDAFGPAWGESHHMAYMCVHPGRSNPARVNRDDAPYNTCASKGARSCPLKVGDE